MKKSLVLGILGLAVASTQSYGQGKVNFGNYWSASQTTGVTYANGPDAGKFVGPEMSATLLWGASGATSGLTPVAGSTIAFGLGAASGPGAVGTGAGWFSAGTVQINGGVAGSYAFQVSVAGLDHGVSYTGTSAIVNGPTQATSTSPVPNLPDALLKGSFTVAAAPEPSVLALSGIGAAALMLVRRKK